MDKPETTSRITYLAPPDQPTGTASWSRSRCGTRPTSGPTRGVALVAHPGSDVTEEVADDDCVEEEEESEEEEERERVQGNQKGKGKG